MQDVLKELGLYDLMGYLVPGAVLLWALLASGTGVAILARAERRVGTAVWFLISAYVLGQMLQAAGSGLERTFYRDHVPQSFEKFYAIDPKTGKDPHRSFRNELVGLTQEAFKGQDGDLFTLSQVYTRVRGQHDFLETLQARSAFFRGLTVALFLAGVAFLSGPFQPSRPAILRAKRRSLVAQVTLAVVFLAGAVGAFYRFRDFDRYYTDGVYRTLYVDYRLQHPK